MTTVCLEDENMDLADYLRRIAAVPLTSGTTRYVPALCRPWRRKQ